MLRAQVEMLEERAAACPSRAPAPTPTCSPTTSTARCRGSPTPSRSTSDGCAQRAGLDHLDFHDLRKFMETYGQEMGYSVAQVAMRAGHDPSVAARHYSGRVVETDRDLAEAVASLLTPTS